MSNRASGGERRVLILVYLFPPRGGVGVMRCLSFARYLPEFNCRIWVVTAGNASNAYYDPTLLKQVPPEVEVHRTFTPELPFAWRTWLWKRLRRPGAKTAAPRAGAQAAAGGNVLQRLVRSVATPDPQKVWLPFALARASRLIRKHNIDTVIVSVPPFSELEAAVRLKRQFPHLRTVLDFRDEWLDFTLSSIETAGARQKLGAAAELERKAVEAADVVLSVTPSWVARIRERYPAQAADKFQYLPNGYDDEVFRDFEARRHQGGQLVMTYVGTAYARDVYSPEPFLKAVDDLEEEVRSKLEVRFIGRVEPEIGRALENRGYRIVQYGFLPQNEALRLAAETDVLLVFANDPAWRPAKLFEYLAMGKFILAVAPPGGETAVVVEETHTGRTVSPEDAEAIRAAVRDMAALHGKGIALGPAADAAAVQTYSRRSLAARLAGIISAVRSSTT